MCGGCVTAALEDDGPVTITADMLAVAAKVSELYAAPWGACGGPLHVQLDDFNLDDAFVSTPRARVGFMKWVAEWRRDRRDGFDEVGAALCMEIHSGLIPMSEAERNVTVAIAHGYLHPFEPLEEGMVVWPPCPHCNRWGPTDDGDCSGCGRLVNEPRDPPDPVPGTERLPGVPVISDGPHDLIRRRMV